MKVFGLTGGIGMGKSTAAQLLRQRNFPVVDTDVLAREIVESGQPALREIQETFGRQVIGPDGRLDRAALARIAFADPAARQTLESITHPRIRALWRNQVEIWRAERREVGVVVIPLLFETGAEAELDATICVACSAAAQQIRLQERGWDATQIAQRIAAQWPTEKKIARAHFMVWTEGSPEVLDEQLSRILW